MTFLEWFQQGVMLGICGFETFLFYGFFQSEFEFRRKKKVILLAELFLLAGAIFGVNSLGITQFNLIVVPCLYLVMALIIFKPHFKSAISYTIIFYTILAGGEVVFENLYRIVSYRAGIMIDVTSPDFVLLLIGEKFIEWLFFKLIERSKRNLGVGIKAEYEWYLLIIPVSSLVVLSIFVYMDFPESEFVQNLVCIGSLLMYFADAVEFILLEKFSYTLNQMKSLEMLSMKSEIEQKSFERLDEVNQRYLKLIHDMNSYVGVIRELKKQQADEEIDNIIDDLNKKERDIMEGVYSQNKVFNAIINDRVQLADKKEIQLDIFVEPNVYIDFIDDSDMISMFGNLLDNAIEAAAECDKKFVDVKLFMGSDYFLVLNIQNSFKSTHMTKKGRYRTTKPDRQYHGIGIGNVERLAEKYGGVLVLTEGKDVFTTILALSVIKVA